jgi:hypothetical protein
MPEAARKWAQTTWRRLGVGATVALFTAISVVAVRSTQPRVLPGASSTLGYPSFSILVGTICAATVEVALALVWLAAVLMRKWPKPTTGEGVSFALEIGRGAATNQALNAIAAFLVTVVSGPLLSFSALPTKL